VPFHHGDAILHGARSQILVQPCVLAADIRHPCVQPKRFRHPKSSLVIDIERDWICQVRLRGDQLHLEPGGQFEPLHGQFALVRGFGDLRRRKRSRREQFTRRSRKNSAHQKKQKAPHKGHSHG
jgi:hypothetical protein